MVWPHSRAVNRPWGAVCLRMVPVDLRGRSCVPIVQRTVWRASGHLRRAGNVR